MEQGTRRVELWKEPLVAAGPRAHPLAGREALDLRELESEVWTAPSKDGIVARACQAAGFSPDIRLVVRGPLAIGHSSPAGRRWLWRRY